MRTQIACSVIGAFVVAIPFALIGSTYIANHAPNFTFFGQVGYEAGLLLGMLLGLLTGEAVGWIIPKWVRALWSA